MPICEVHNLFVHHWNILSPILSYTNCHIPTGSRCSWIELRAAQKIMSIYNNNNE